MAELENTPEPKSWVNDELTVDTRGIVTLNDARDYPPARWRTNDDAQQYLLARQRNLTRAKVKAKAAGRPVPWSARTSVVLRLGAAVNTVGCLYSTNRHSAGGYFQLKAAVLGRRVEELTDKRLPQKWESIENVRAHLDRTKHEVIKMREATNLSAQEARAAGSVERQQQSYTNLLLALGAALDAVACAYASWWVNAPEYSYRRHELLSIYSRGSVVSLEELTAK